MDTVSHTNPSVSKHAGLFELLSFFGTPSTLHSAPESGQIRSHSPEQTKFESIRGSDRCRDTLQHSGLGTEDSGE